MKYDLRRLMRKAWSLHRKASRKAVSSFAEALRTAWAWLKVQAANAVKVEAAAEAAGYADDEVHTWAGWQSLGQMVIHTSEAVFKVEVADPTTRKGARIQPYLPTFSNTRMRSSRKSKATRKHCWGRLGYGFRPTAQIVQQSVVQRPALSGEGQCRARRFSERLCSRFSVSGRAVTHK